MADNTITQGTEANTVDNTENTAENQESNAPESTQNAAETKTFTQEDVDKIVAKRLKAEREKSKERTRTDAERITDLENRLNASERRNALADAGCDKKFAKFVTSEVSAMDGDFVENLAKYKSENPQFFASATKATSNQGGSSPRMSGGNPTKNPDDAINEGIRKIFTGGKK